MRTVFAGGRVFDGTGAAVAEADVAVVDGQIVEVGVGLDGDEQVDVAGATLLPGLFDTHVHVMFGHVDVWRLMQEPFSYRFYDAIRNLERPFASASRPCATPAAPTSASSGRSRRGSCAGRGCRSRSRC